MGIGPRKQKIPTFCARYSFERLHIACTKTATAELINVFRLKDVNKLKVEQLLYLLVFI